MSYPKQCLPVPWKKRKRITTTTSTTSDNNHQHNTSRDVGDSFHNIDEIDAETYLQRVSEEAHRLPEIFQSEPRHRIPLTSTASSTKQTNPIILGSAAHTLKYMLTTSENAIHPPPTIQHAPTDGVQWVEQILNSFSQLRNYLEQCRDQGIGCDKTKRRPVPFMKDRLGWYTYCVGEDTASGNVAGYYDDDDNEDDDDENDNGGIDPKDNQDMTESDNPAWRQNLPSNGHPPDTSLLLQLDQVMIRRVLAHLTYYCHNEDNKAIPYVAPWLYALLARLERPIHRDDAVTLYSLLKALTAARAVLPVSKRHEIASLNVLIAVVGVYFEQGGGYANVMEAKEC